MKKLAALFIIFALILTAAPVSAEFAEGIEAKPIPLTITGTGYGSFNFLTDSNVKSYKTSSGDTELTIESETEMTGLYLMFDLEYGAYTIVDNDNAGKLVNAGQHGFLHEYVELEAPTTSVTVKFTNGAVRLSEITAFYTDPDEPYYLPDYVQRWEAPLEGKTDLMLLATHGDDDQLFFAGLLPYYAAERDLAVQVVYLTDHRNLTYARTHEMINGLWSVGVRAYPVFGDFADFRIDSLQVTYDYYKTLGTSKEELQNFVVEQLRRFKPQAVVAHDINGEYGHGMHMVYTDLFINALDLTNDETYHADSADKYGVYDIPKAYIHLYEENPIVIDYDTPLESFDGMTAFQVTQKYGYPCHESQQYTWFTDWINGKYNEITKASQIKTYNPCNFGLYRTLVGADAEKNDFFENLVSYEEQERIAAEKAEQERLEAERLEAERLEAERKEKERIEAENQQRMLVIGAIIAAAVLCVIVCIVMIGKKKGAKKIKPKHYK